jgi:D-arabinose 1-dehydrogenase-like Zn-dependent alcohol dehydrogenase
VSIARPRPGPDAALVRVRAVGLCGSWLAVLAGTVPAERLAAMRLIVAPGTIVRWHRDLVRRR